MDWVAQAETVMARTMAEAAKFRTAMAEGDVLG